MVRPKKEWEPKIINIVPEGTKLADGTILEKETELSQEEFAKNPPVIPDGHPVYNVLDSIIREKIEKGEL